MSKKIKWRNTQKKSINFIKKKLLTVINNDVPYKYEKTGSHKGVNYQGINFDIIAPVKEKITIGQDVLVKPLNQIGTILSLPNKSNKVTIQIGSMKTNFDISNLIEIEQPKKEKTIPIKKESNF